MERGAPEIRQVLQRVLIAPQLITRTSKATCLNVLGLLEELVAHVRAMIILTNFTNCRYVIHDPMSLGMGRDPGQMSPQSATAHALQAH